MYTISDDNCYNITEGSLEVHRQQPRTGTRAPPCSTTQRQKLLALCQYLQHLLLFATFTVIKMSDNGDTLMPDAPAANDTLLTEAELDVK